MALIVELEDEDNVDKDRTQEPVQRVPEKLPHQRAQRPEKVRRPRVVQLLQIFPHQGVQLPERVSHQRLQPPENVPNQRTQLPEEQRVHPPAPEQRTQQPETDQNRRLRVLRRLAILTAIFLTGLVIGIVLYSNISAGEALLDDIPVIVNRTYWQASPPKSVKLVDSPVLNVIISHTGTRECKTSDECELVLHKLQVFHMSRGFYDIAYNFLIGGNGVVYEGRGWGVEYSATHVSRERSLGISFIGSFSNVQPPEKQMLAARQLINLGVKEGYIAKTYKLSPDWDPAAAMNPGQELFNSISHWPHWSPS